MTNHHNIKIPFTLYDFGWVVLCIGMAIGSGIVLMPIQIGLKGIWVFLFSILLSYPAIYLLQNLYLRTLSETKECDNYTGIISQYLGKNWGIGLGIIYFLMLLTGILGYSLAITYDGASYFKTFGLTKETLSDTFWFPLVLISLLVIIASQGERLLFKISGPMVIIKFGIILTLGFFMIPHWNFENIKAMPDFLSFTRDVFLTLPFTLYSILFVQILNPMNIAYRKIEEDKEIATYRAIRTNRIAYYVLAVGVLFYAFSFTFSISYEQAVSAFEQNISALAIAAQVLPGSTVKVMATVLNIFSLITAFLGIYLGIHESLKGILVNLTSRFIPKERINNRLLNIFIGILVILSLSAWVSTKFPVLLIFQLAGPLYGIVACLIPVYLVYKVESLCKYKKYSTLYIAFFGLLLCISPLLKFFEL